MLLVVPFALCLAEPLQEEIRGDDPWKGFGIGSWAARIDRRKQGEKITEERERLTVAEVKDGRVMLKRDSAKEDGTIGHALGWAPEGSWLVSKVAESIIVDSREIRCAVLDYKWSDDQKQIKGSATYWVAADDLVPYREVPLNGPDLALPPKVLKIRFANLSPRQEVRVELQVRSLSRKHRIGDRELTCVAEEGTVKEGPAEGTMRRLLSGKVPGHDVEFVAEGKAGDVRFERRRQVTDFQTHR